jgi:hypothetical protein
MTAKEKRPVMYVLSATERKLAQLRNDAEAFADAVATQLPAQIKKSAFLS